MHHFNELLLHVDGFIGDSHWFAFVLLGTGLFFTLYLGFPQFRYFRHAIRCARGKFDKATDPGDTSHFQALATALSGTVGTGNIAGVALAVYMGGPAALFWMLMTAAVGMTTKFVEVTLSHKYREQTADGTMAGGPMYYMKNRLNMKWLAVIFAVATVFSSFGTGSLPQVNSIANSLFATFALPKAITGAVLAVLLAFVIIGGIRRIAQVTARLVPFMAITYFIGGFMVIAYNYDSILPSMLSVVSDVFTGSAAAGGFLGAGISMAFYRGVNRGLFSNEAGQGSAPIAHAAARADEPVSEGMVAILEPFIDTIVICSVTGLVILSSGVWKEKHFNRFQYADQKVLGRVYSEAAEADRKLLYDYLNKGVAPEFFSGSLEVDNGVIRNEVSILHARSLAEEVRVLSKGMPYTGSLEVRNGNYVDPSGAISFEGRSLLHSAPLTVVAFTSSFLGDFGQYIVAIGLLLFAFSTAISWSYYGDRAMTFLFGPRSILYYRIVYVSAFFVASFTDTTIIWNLSAITIAVMTLPNLFGILVLHREMKDTVREYWQKFRKENPESPLPRGVRR
jgi:alanine or glycine:cation symporter, AGCS family